MVSGIAVAVERSGATRSQRHQRIGFRRMPDIPDFWMQLGTLAAANGVDVACRAEMGAGVK
jgi:hypothetical protein